MVMGLVSGCLWPMILTQAPSWWRTHRSAEMDSSQEDSGRLVGCMDWHLLSPFDLCRILVVGGSLLVPHSLPGPPVVRELMQVVTIGPGQDGWFQSVVPLTQPLGKHPWCGEDD